MRPIGICALFRDEANHLLEWIAYHLAIGFDHIVLFNNDSRDGGAEHVAQSIFAPFITLIDWPERPGQMTAYQYFADHLAKSFEWVAFIDIDEFVHPLEHTSIREVLPTFADASCVQIQWLTFGSSGHVARPSALTLEAYDMRLPEYDLRCGWVKSLARGDDLVGMTDEVHMMEVTGRMCNTRGETVKPTGVLPRCHDVMTLNHYYTRSKEDWSVKRGRGYAARLGVNSIYRDQDFDEHDALATVRDKRIKRFVPLVKQTLVSGPVRTIQPVDFPGSIGPRPRWLARSTPRPEQDVMRPALSAGKPANLPSPDNGPVIHIEPGDVLLVPMIQFMMALKFASLVPGCRISNVHLPAWGIALPRIDVDGPSFTFPPRQKFDGPSLSERMNAGEFRCLNYSDVSPRMENFLDRERYRGLFESPRHRNIGYGADHLVCHLGPGDTPWRPNHCNVLTPVEFYCQIVARTGLQPVFIGNTLPSRYIASLQAALPHATIMPPGYTIRDFEIIRQSRNIVVGCSKLSWLAAWLSDAQEIVFPVNGALSPFQNSQFDLLPFDDPRYRFYLFPINHAVGEADHAACHRAMAGLWREIPHDHLRQLATGAPRVPRRIEPFLEVFDEHYYLSQFASVRKGVEEGWLKSGLAHFTRWGFPDGLGWWAFELDETWYTTQYPIAAVEIGQGDYADCRHHYAEIGRRRGYKPVRPG